MKDEIRIEQDYDLENGVTLAHVQGYLFGLQEISNALSFSPGKMNEYSISRFECSGLLKKEQMVRLMLGGLEQDLRHIRYLNEKSTFSKLENWQVEFPQRIDKWMLDRNLNINVALRLQEAPFTVMSEEDLKVVRERMENSAKQMNARILQCKPSGSSLTWLIGALLKSDKTEVWEFCYTHAVRIGEAPPGLRFSRDWGVPFSLFYLTNQNDHFILHMGEMIV